MKRREFGRVLAGGAVFGAAGGQLPTDGGSLTDVEGIRVGHFTSSERPTGCTVILTPDGATAGVDVRGSAPGTRETDLLDPVNMVQEVHAVVLSGGSAFGLESATGVVRYLGERDIGFTTGARNVPIVSAAILYDLGLGDPSIFPDADAGYRACLAATTEPVSEGNVGAGAGATVGKSMGPGRAMKGGLGTASFTTPEGIVVGAIVAVNAVGNIVDPANGRIVAGARNDDGTGFLDTRRLTSFDPGEAGAFAENTTIGLVATNAAFTKTQMTKVAQMAQDALARTIYPAHTPSDGDAVFALSTGAREGGANLGGVGALAAEVLARAILRAVLAAESIPGFPAARDFP